MSSIVCWFAVMLGSAGGDDLCVLPRKRGETLQSAPLYSYLKQLACAAIERRQAAYEQVKTAEQAKAWQRARREFLLRQVGEFPERTPLNPRVVGKMAGDSYRMETVIYESRPKHHVTAVVYLPAGKPPYPAVLIPCGHSYNGKAFEPYQRLGILLARNGLAALCFDPIGQGERYQVLHKDGTPLVNPDPNPYSRKLLAAVAGSPQFNPVEEHTVVGVGSILLGLNTVHYRVYDGMRSLDYLASRPDIDPKRIGCCGNSGGGTMTSYLMDLDDRILAAAPGCFLTTYRRLIDKPGPQDAEQNIFGQLAFGMDEADYVLVRAPKPTLICAATRDGLFDVLGSWEIFREAKRFFARFGLPERVDLVETDEPHGFTLQLREGTAHWMRRWLMGIDQPVNESEQPIRTDAELQCTARGQVLFLPGERSVFDLNLELNARLAAQRRRFWAETPKLKVREAVRTLVGARRAAALPQPKQQTAGTLDRGAYRIEKLILHPEPGIELPALAFLPPQPNDDAYLYLDGRGKQADAAAGGPIESLVRGGHLVLAVDLRGLGETELKTKLSSYRLREQEYFLAYLLGRSLVGMRTEDVFTCARFLAGFRSSGKARRVHLVGIGTAGVPALHAAALEPELFASARLRRVLASWSHVLATPVTENQLINTVHGVLRTYDLPDLVQSLDPRTVTVEEPVDAVGKPVP